MKNAKTLWHLHESGSARMVNVGAKPVQRRRAVAQGTLACAPAIREGVAHLRGEDPHPARHSDVAKP